jgi:hypothetical protein
VDKRRTVLAFIVAPLVVPPVFAVPALVPFHGRDYLTILIVMSIYGLPVAYLFEILLGIPAWLLFRACRFESLLAFALGGAVIGLVVDGIMKTASKTLHEWSLADTLYVLAALGSALLFRVIALGTHRMSSGTREF